MEPSLGGGGWWQEVNQATLASLRDVTCLRRVVLPYSRCPSLCPTPTPTRPEEKKTFPCTHKKQFGSDSR